MSSQPEDMNNSAIRMMRGILKSHIMVPNEDRLQFLVNVKECVVEIQAYLKKEHTLDESEVAAIRQEVAQAEERINRETEDYAISYVDKYFRKHAEVTDMHFEMELEDEHQNLPKELNEWNQTVERYNRALQAVIALRKVDIKSYDISVAQQQLTELNEAKSALDKGHPYEFPTFRKRGGSDAGKIIQLKINEDISDYVAKFRKHPREGDAFSEIRRLDALINNAVTQYKAQQEVLAARREETIFKAKRDAETAIAEAKSSIENDDKTVVETYKQAKEKIKTFRSNGGRSKELKGYTGDDGLENQYQEWAQRKKQEYQFGTNYNHNFFSSSSNQPSGYVKKFNSVMRKDKNSPSVNLFKKAVNAVLDDYLGGWSYRTHREAVKELQKSIPSMSPVQVMSELVKLRKTAKDGGKLASRIDFLAQKYYSEHDALTLTKDSKLTEDYSAEWYRGMASIGPAAGDADMKRQLEGIKAVLQTYVNKKSPFTKHKSFISKQVIEKIGENEGLNSVQAIFDKLSERENDVRIDREGSLYKRIQFIETMTGATLKDPPAPNIINK